MLPRLQRLRDNRWVIFILATNIEELEELDEAVRRPGRFDFADEIGHPKLRAQQRYIEEHRRQEELGEKRVRQFQAALEDFAKGDSREVPFAVIDYVIAGVLDDGWPDTKAQIATRLRDRMRDVDRPPSLGTAAGYHSGSTASA
jgi:SpoVK/Ycf46/Vps4 family AAA+-type ATPase